MITDMDKYIKSALPIFPIAVRVLGLDDALILSVILKSLYGKNEEILKSSDYWFDVSTSYITKLSMTPESFYKRLQVLRSLNFLECSMKETIQIKLYSDPIQLLKKMESSTKPTAKQEAPRKRKRAFLKMYQSSLSFGENMPLPLKKIFESSSELCKLWELFIQMRKEIKKPLTKTAFVSMAPKFLSFIEEFNVEEFIKLLQRSIDNEWKGIIFEDDWKILRKKKRSSAPINFESGKDDIDYQKYKCKVPAALRAYVHFFENRYGQDSISENEKWTLSRCLNILTTYHKYALMHSELYRYKADDVRPIGLAKSIYDVYLMGVFKDKDFSPRDMDARFGKVFSEIMKDYQRKLNLNLSTFEPCNTERSFNMFSFLERKGLLP